MKKWLIHQPDDQIVQKLRLGSDLSGLCAGVLAARGFSSVQQAADFLVCNSLSDPALIADMEEAAGAINNAIAEGKHICVYGDYDCDGIMSTIILYDYLMNMGAQVSYRIPEREEGYGLNANVVQELHDKGVELIVTVDNGITAIEEAKQIHALGMELVVTDHHAPLDVLPEALAVVDAHRLDDTSPYHQYCGAGIALKLVAAMEDGDLSMALEQYGDLAALATIADVVEISGENRYLVRAGLRLLANTERPGLLALLEHADLKGKTLTSTSIAFRAAPRINAAGRFGSPTTAVEMLMTDDPETADALAQELDKRNTLRKKAEDEILKEIEAQAESDPMLLLQRVLIFSGENWHHGVIGIAAARLQERFGKPTILLTKEGAVTRGSMRSFGDFSAFRCLDACSELLTKYGGHPKAGGLSLPTEKVEAFYDAVQAYALENHPDMPVMTLEADKLLMPEELTVDSIRSLQTLAPFGEGNEQPVFALCHAVLQRIVSLSNGQHSKLLILYGTRTLELLLFRVRPEEVTLPLGGVCDFLVTAEVGEFKGTPSVSLIITDMRKSGIKQARYFAGRETYEKLRRGEALPSAYYQRLTPTRNELAEIYKRLPAQDTPIDALYIAFQGVEWINYCKLRIAVDIFEELGLARQSVWREEVQRVPVAQRVSLDQSMILQRLTERGKEHETG